MTALLKYWPMIGTLVGLGANGFMFWFIWSMRQWMRNEVEVLLATAVARLEAVDGKTDAAVDALEDRMTKVEGEVTGVRRDIGQLPTKADIARVEGEIKGVASILDITNRGIRRLEEIFLENGVNAGRG